jgi:DNA invertase Pin-like site-specific DNA recombinase
VPRKRSLLEPANRSTLPTMVGAVIYVRVSTKEQTENLSLPTQLRACEEYCRRQGYEVLERFHEEGERAKSTDRSQLQNLLAYCRLNKGRVHFVVVFNLTRFARDKYDHFALRSHLQSLGISLRSATEPIDDTSTGKLMEGVLAAFAQFDNDCRSDRTRAGMKAALELGRWVFLAPLGYLNAPRAMGKSLMADPERAPLVRRGFEEYATGRYTKEQLLKQTRAWNLTNRRGGPLTSQAVGMLLRNRLYAGIVDVPEYGVRAKRGDFELLISGDFFHRVQAGAGRSRAKRGVAPRTPDLPLRAFVRCDSRARGLPPTGRRAGANLTQSAVSRRRGRSRTSGSVRRPGRAPRFQTPGRRRVSTVGISPCDRSGQRCAIRCAPRHCWSRRCKSASHRSCYEVRRQSAWSRSSARQDRCLIRMDVKPDGFPCFGSRRGCLQNLEGCRVLRNLHASAGRRGCAASLRRHQVAERWLAAATSVDQMLAGPPSPLGGFGETSFAWLA